MSSNSIKENHEGSHSIDDHQPSNDVFKVRHESSDSAISSGSGLSPVNKSLNEMSVCCPSCQHKSYIYFVTYFVGVA